MILDPTREGALTRAADALAAGQLIGLPTETVYGLAADAQNADAVARIFSAKGRPANHPLIIHIASAEAAERFAAAMPPVAARLAAAFWPGPLTLILPRRPGVADTAAGGHPTIGLRCPQHPVAQSLLAACATRGLHGLAAPSANRFGRISPTTAAHVAAEFADLLVLDGGPCAIGIESAIVDCSRAQPALLRPGALSAAALEQAAGQRLSGAHEAAGPATPAPGTLSAHYAPRAKLRLMDAKTLQTALDVLGPQARHIAIWARARLKTDARQILLRPMPAQPEQAAHELFATLRSFDDAQVKLIWVETPPPEADWAGVADRLHRAAASD